MKALRITHTGRNGEQLGRLADIPMQHDLTSVTVNLGAAGMFSVQVVDDGEPSPYPAGTPVVELLAHELNSVAMGRPLTVSTGDGRELVVTMEYPGRPRVRTGGPLYRHRGDDQPAAEQGNRPVPDPRE